MDKKIVFSGVQPSGALTIGNYIGAIKNWVPLQEEYGCFFCIVDMHAITVRQTPAELRKRTLDVASLYMAAGMDPEKSVIYVQSHVKAHAELAWILNCYAYMGELSRMTQFKEKSEKHADNINAGLFTYPVLMAADILLYNTDLVPVGADQKQHIEITRDIALRFNNIYGDVFKIPGDLILKAGARIMSLQEPEKKMSKSDENPNAYITMLDPPDVIRAKVRRAVTDSGSDIRFSEEKPGVSNLLMMYAAMKEVSVEEAEKAFSGLNYGALKEGVAEAVVARMAPLQEKYKAIREDKDALTRTLKEGAEKAAYASEKMLRKVKRKIGYIEV